MVSEYIGSPAEQRKPQGLLSKISKQFSDALSQHSNPRRLSMLERKSPLNPSIKATIS
jgi:hypothetical protein